MAQHRARVQYQHSQIAVPGNAQLVQQVSQPGFIAHAMQQMNLAQMLRLKQVADNVTRCDKIAEAVDHIMIPELQQMIEQRDELERTIKAMSQAFECTFAENYTNDNGFNTEPFYSDLETRITALQNQAVQDQINDGVQQGIQQMQAAAPSGAVPMQEN